MMAVGMVLVLASTTLIATVAQDDPQTLELGHGCSPDTYKYVNQTAFQDNLDAAFASLASNISSSNTSFYATSVIRNGNTDPVYALCLCRKYLTSKECLQCFTAAEKSIKETCSYQGFNGARIHMDGCLLRYENSTFFEQGTDGGFSNFCASVYDTKPKKFNQTAETLLSQLTTDALMGDKYALGQVAYNASTVVYALAQCVPIISETTCEECLKDAQNLVVNCLLRHEGRGLQAGCFMRYAISPFYNTTATTNVSKRNFKTWPILLGSIAGAALLAALCSVFIWRRFKERFKRYFRATYLYNETETGLAAAETFEPVVFDYDVLREATENSTMQTCSEKEDMAKFTREDLQTEE